VYKKSKTVVHCSIHYNEYKLKLLSILFIHFIVTFVFGVPHLATCIFLFFYNEPELGVGIDPGMALIPLPSSIGQGLTFWSWAKCFNARPQLSLCQHTYRIYSRISRPAFKPTPQLLIKKLSKIVDRHISRPSMTIMLFDIKNA